MGKHRLAQVQLLQNLIVPLKQLDGVKTLLFLRQSVYCSLLDMGKGVLDRSRKSVHGNRLPVLRRIDCSLRSFHDAAAFQGRNLDNLAAQSLRQLRRINLIAVFLHHVHHVDGNDNRDAKLGKLCGQVQVSLQIRAVDNI